MKRALFACAILLCGIQQSYAVEAKDNQYYYKLLDFNGSEKKITLEDGSVWEVSPEGYSPGFVISSRTTLDQWDAGDDVQISDNTSWVFYTNFQYCFTNKKTGEYLYANMISPSDPENKKAIRIIDLDQETISIGKYTTIPTALIIELSDGSQWIVYPKDQHECTKWKVDDRILIGRLTSSKKETREEYVGSTYDYNNHFHSIYIKHTVCFDNMIINETLHESIAVCPFNVLKRNSSQP